MGIPPSPPVGGGLGGGTVVSYPCGVELASGAVVGMQVNGHGVVKKMLDAVSFLFLLSLG